LIDYARIEIETTTAFSFIMVDNDRSFPNHHALNSFNNNNNYTRNHNNFAMMNSNNNFPRHGMQLSNYNLSYGRRNIAAIGSVPENKPLSLRQVTAAEYQRYSNNKRTLSSIENNVDSRPTKQKSSSREGDIKVKVEDNESMVTAVPKRSCLKNSTYGNSSLPSSKMQVTNGQRKSRWGPKVVIPGDENISQVNVKVEKKIRRPLKSCLKQSSDANEVKVKAEKISLPIGQLKKEANSSSQETAAASLQPSQQPTSEKAALDAVVQFAIDTGKVDSKLFKTALTAGYSKFFILSEVEGHLLKQKPCAAANASSTEDDEASESDDDDDIQTDVLYKDDYSVINDARELLSTDNQVANYTLRNRDFVDYQRPWNNKLLSKKPKKNACDERLSADMKAKTNSTGDDEACESSDGDIQNYSIINNAHELPTYQGRERTVVNYFRFSGKIKAKILSVLPINNGKNEGVALSYINKNVQGLNAKRELFETGMADSIEFVTESRTSRKGREFLTKKYFKIGQGSVGSLPQTVSSYQKEDKVSIHFSDDMKAKILSVLPINNGVNEGVSLGHIKKNVHGFKDLCNKDKYRRELLETGMADSMETIVESHTPRNGIEVVSKRYFRANQVSISSLPHTNITASSVHSRIRGRRRNTIKPLRGRKGSGELDNHTQYESFVRT